MPNGNKIGFIARIDDTGLGIEAKEFIEHVGPDAIFEVRRGQKVSDEEAKYFLGGIDVLVAYETPYNMRFFEFARKAGVRSAMRVNYEYLAHYSPVTRPDIFIAPIAWHLGDIPDPKIMLPSPVDTEKIKAREIRTARTFVHIEGNGGYMDRNGTNLLMQALPLIRSEFKLIVYSQKKISPAFAMDHRVEWRGMAKNYWEMYKEGDVLLYPRRHSGQSLIVNEAQAAGMPVMMTDMEPLRDEIDPELRIPVKRMLTVDIQRRIEFAEIDPAAIAEKVDEWYDQDIWEFSKKAVQRASQKSWKALLTRYRQTFSNL